MEGGEDLGRTRRGRGITGSPRLAKGCKPVQTALEPNRCGIQGVSGGVLRGCDPAPAGLPARALGSDTLSAPFPGVAQQRELQGCPHIVDILPGVCIG